MIHKDSFMGALATSFSPFRMHSTLAPMRRRCSRVLVQSNRVRVDVDRCRRGKELSIHFAVLSFHDGTPTFGLWWCRVHFVRRYVILSICIDFLRRSSDNVAGMLTTCKKPAEPPA